MGIFKNKSQPLEYKVVHPSVQLNLIVSNKCYLKYHNLRCMYLNYFRYLIVLFFIFSWSICQNVGNKYTWKESLNKKKKQEAYFQTRLLTNESSPHGAKLCLLIKNDVGFILITSPFEIMGSNCSFYHSIIVIKIAYNVLNIHHVQDSWGYFCELERYNLRKLMLIYAQKKMQCDEK